MMAPVLERNGKGLRRYERVAELVRVSVVLLELL
jgi:hypothetical protein